MIHRECLFFGLFVDDEVGAFLEALDAPLRHLLMEGGDYFQTYRNEEELWLGRFIEEVESLASLELIQSHLLSLQRRFLPVKSGSTPLWLFPTIQIENS